MSDRMLSRPALGRCRPGDREREREMKASECQVAYFHMCRLNIWCFVHELLEVIVQVFKDEIQLPVTVKDFH